MSAALKMEALPEKERIRNPDVYATVRGDGRKIAVAKLREFADMLESGELDGCGFYWRDDHGANTEMVTVTVTHATEEHGGMVTRFPTTIEEV
jgi:hypothetical protein